MTIEDYWPIDDDKMPESRDVFVVDKEMAAKILKVHNKKK